MLCRAIALGGLLEQRVAGLLVRHGIAVGDDAGFAEPAVDGYGRAVALEASAVAAIAGQAIDVDADVPDFRGSTLGSVDKPAIIDHAEADAFAQ